MQKFAIPSKIPRGWAPLPPDPSLVEPVRQPHPTPVATPPMAILLRCIEHWLELRSAPTQTLLSMKVNLRAATSHSLWASCACLGRHASRIEIREAESGDQWNSLGIVELEREALGEDLLEVCDEGRTQPATQGVPPWLIEDYPRLGGGHLPAGQVRSIADIVTRFSDVLSLQLEVDWNVSEQSASLRQEAA